MMTDTQQQARAPETRRKGCGWARFAGILGLIVALWFLAYAVQDIPENPMAILKVIFMGIMMLGSLFDCVRIGREGMGGLVVLIGGTVFYVYLFIDFTLLKQFGSGDNLASIIGTLLLFLAGFLFYSCGRRREKEK